MKTAFLVQFSPITRVVVDVDDSSIFPANDEDWYKVVEAAKQQILENGVGFYICSENLEDIKLDTEMPYDKETDL